MCPEPQTLSAYFDGEMSAQRAKAIETHIAACSACQKKLLSLQSIRDTLSRVENPEYRGLMKKVWTRIREYRQKAAVGPVPIFKRSLSVPLPIAALAAVLIVLLGFSAVYYLARGDFRMLKLTNEPSGIMEVRVASPIEYLEVILKSLESHEFKKETVIQLPTNSQFLILGEPVLIRADELKRFNAQ